MILVSGTKRSGTSMWMQILVAGGLPVLGKAFPRNWETSALKEANRDGFYEGLFRQGIYYRTNPHPQTGAYFLPEDVKGYAVKVFVPGVVRTERAFIDRVVANLRPWREYEASIQRLYALEDGERRDKAPDAPEPFRFPPALEWWMENFALVRDISLRRYPAQLQTYEQVLADPERAIGPVLEAAGIGDLAAAVAAVKPENQTQHGQESEAVDDKLARVFDDLYDLVEQRRPLEGAFLKTLNDTNQAMLPTLRELQTKVAKSMSARARPAEPS